MANKPFNARIQLKHDTETHWLLASNFSPKDGELIIYDVDTNHAAPRLKVGDGTTNVNSLPFVEGKAGNPNIIVTSENLAASDTINLDLSSYSMQNLANGQLLFIFLQSATIGSTNLTISYSFDGLTYNSISGNVKKASSSFSAAFSAGTLLELLYYNSAFHIINAPLTV